MARLRSRLVWRRTATAAGLYVSVALGILGTIVAARVLGLDEFGVFATALAAAGFLQTLTDLTVEEALTKYGFRYVARARWGRLRRLFRGALVLKLAGGAVASLLLVLLAPVADRVFDADGLATPILAVALLPLVQAPEAVASTGLLLRGRYDLRGGFLALSMGLRLLAIAIGVRYGVTEALLGMVAAQAVSTVAVGVAGLAALRRFPSAAPEPLGEDRAEIRSFVLQSSVATGVLSLRQTMAPLLLGVVAGPTSVGLFRVAQSPQTGLTAVSSPVRLVLLTEQTRDWEHGKVSTVFRGLRRYTRWALGVMAVTVPVFFVTMPWLVELVFGEEYEGAVTAARIVLLAAAIVFVLGWTKSFPTTIGRPRLRIVTHGAEALVQLPLVLLLGARWGVTGAAVAVLCSAIVFAGAWAIVLVRLRGELRAARITQAQGALAP